MTCAPNSLNALWTVIAGSGVTTEQDLTPLKPSDVLAFVEPALSHLQSWSQLFTQVPNDHAQRKDALGGVLKIKASIKKLEKVSTSLAASAGSSIGSSTSNASDGEPQSSSPEATPTLAELLQESRTAWHEAVFGMLEVSFPVDEVISSNDFLDVAAHTASMSRMQVATELSLTLGVLLARAKVNLKPIQRSSEEPLAPEVLKVLEKSMKKQQKKDKKKGNSSGSTNAVNFNAARSTWEQTEGRGSCILGEELWEGLNWRRGLNLFCYIKCLLDEQTPGDSEDKEEAVQDAQISEPRPPPTQELFGDAMHSFYMMLIAQGPILANRDDPALWQATSDGPHEDETARMYYQGIYSSMHLRGLKHLAELGYWRWKHSGMKAEDASLAAIINRKFVHVVTHIMPHAGWTAQVEYDRILEMETATLASSEFSNGLGSKPDGSGSRSKPKVVVVPGESKGKAGAAGADSAGKNVTGSAVSSTAPVR